MYNNQLMLKLGSRLNGYEIMEFLGKGRFAHVYQAHQKKPDRIVALKYFISSDIDYDAILDEAWMLAEFNNHPHIVAIHDARIIDQRYPILAMQLMGQTLRKRLDDIKESRSFLDTAAAISIVLQLCDALWSIHQKGFCHRDVKPENVFFDRDGEVVKLGDLGCCVYLGTEEAKMRAGTPIYMAPEVALGRQAEFQSDVYSLGIVLYELLNGDLPFELMDINEWKLTCREKEAGANNTWIQWPDEPTHEVPDSFKDIVLQATAFDLDTRYETIEEMIIKISLATSGAQSVATSKDDIELDRKTLTVGLHNKDVVPDDFPTLIGISTIDWPTETIEGLTNSDIYLGTRDPIASIEDKLQKMKIRQEKIAQTSTWFVSEFKDDRGRIVKGLTDNMAGVIDSSIHKALDLQNFYLGLEHVFLTLASRKDSELCKRLEIKGDKPREFGLKIKDALEGIRNKKTGPLLTPRLEAVLEKAKVQHPQGVDEKEFLDIALSQDCFISLIMQGNGNSMEEKKTTYTGFEILVGPEDGNIQQLWRDQVRIGRRTDHNDFVLYWDGFVRREPHCRVIRQHKSYIIIDSGSTNGTLIKSQYSLGRKGGEDKFLPVNVEVDLIPGDIIVIGKTWLRFLG